MSVVAQVFLFTFVQDSNGYLIALACIVGTSLVQVEEDGRPLHAKARHGGLDLWKLEGSKSFKPLVQ